jgi:hypothetical protein
MHIFNENENYKNIKNIIEVATFGHNFIHSQTMKVQNERFVTIQTNCQLYLIFYFIFRFYFIKIIFVEDMTVLLVLYWRDIYPFLYILSKSLTIWYLLICNF